MKTYILATEVLDGFGDYVHFHDIVKTIQERPQYQSVELLLIIMHQDARESVKSQRIETQLQALQLPYYHWSSDEWDDPNVDSALVDKLSTADQLIFISAGDVDCFPSKYQNAICNLSTKYIWEHDIFKQDENNNYHRSLGLGIHSYGFKIKPSESMISCNTWEIIQENDPVFAKKLLDCTDSETFDEFSYKNVLIPAYFSFHLNLFCTVLPKLGMNISYPEESKNIVIYYSGSDLSKIDTKYYELDIFPHIKLLINESSNRISSIMVISKILEKTKFKHLEIIQPEETPLIVISGNPNGTQIIKLITGFFVTNSSYDAILKQSKIAGASGDNSLEQCVSMNILPLYAQPGRKKSLDILKHMIQDELIQRAGFSFSNQAKDSFNILLEKSPLPTDYSKLNFPAMIEAWPNVTAYLRKYHNFYDELDQIILNTQAIVCFSDEKACQKMIETICYKKYAILSYLDSSTINLTLSNKFILSLRYTVILIADLCYNQLLSGEDALLLMNKTSLIIDDPSQYREVLKEATSRKEVALEKLCVYLMLIAGYAAKHLTFNNQDNEWIKQANKRLDALETSSCETRSRCCIS